MIGRDRDLLQQTLATANAAVKLPHPRWRPLVERIATRQNDVTASFGPSAFSQPLGEYPRAVAYIVPVSTQAAGALLA